MLETLSEQLQELLKAIRLLNAPLLEVTRELAESDLMAVLKSELDLLPESVELDCCPLSPMLIDLELLKDDPRETGSLDTGPDSDCELVGLSLETLLDKT